MYVIFEQLIQYYHGREAASSYSFFLTRCDSSPDIQNTERNKPAPPHWDTNTGHLFPRRCYLIDKGDYITIHRMYICKIMYIILI